MLVPELVEVTGEPCFQLSCVGSSSSSACVQPGGSSGIFFATLIKRCLQQAASPGVVAEPSYPKPSSCFERLIPSLEYEQTWQLPAEMWKG